MRLIDKFGLALAGFALAVAPVAPAAFAKPVAAAKSEAPRQRFVLLEGGQNFRDMGGYRTTDGHRVKWGMLYRSAAMSRLTAGDFATLQKLGVRTVVDLRSIDERTRAPFSPPAGFTPAVLTRNYDLASSELAKAMMGPQSMNADQARALFERSYTTIPFEFAGQYRAMFAQLLARNVPMIVNCSAGKDRTGVASALILAALGVPRQTIVQDYLLSNPGAQPVKTTLASSAVDPRMRSLSPDVAQVLMGVDARYINAAFKAIDSRPGGLNGYFRDELGLTPADLKRLRTFYVE